MVEVLLAWTTRAVVVAGRGNPMGEGEEIRRERSQDRKEEIKIWSEILCVLAHCGWGLMVWVPTENGRSREALGVGVFRVDNDCWLCSTT